MTDLLTSSERELLDTAHDGGDAAVLVDVVRRLEAEVEALRVLLGTLRKGIEAVSALIDDSTGVDGLHLNGDVAHWDELLAGGRDEVWLLAFSKAADAAD